MTKAPMTPQLASASKMWTETHQPFGSPVQRKVPDLNVRSTNLENSEPANDRGLDDQVNTGVNEGSLAAKLRGFAVPAGDFNNGNGGRNAPARAWKP